MAPKREKRNRHRKAFNNVGNKAAVPVHPNGLPERSHGPNPTQAPQNKYSSPAWYNKKSIKLTGWGLAIAIIALVVNSFFSYKSVTVAENGVNITEQEGKSFLYIQDAGIDFVPTDSGYFKGIIKMYYANTGSHAIETKERIITGYYYGKDIGEDSMEKRVLKDTFPSRVKYLPFHAVIKSNEGSEFTAPLTEWKFNRAEVRAIQKEDMYVTIITIAKYKDIITNNEFEHECRFILKYFPVKGVRRLQNDTRKIGAQSR